MINNNKKAINQEGKMMLEKDVFCISKKNNNLNIYFFFKYIQLYVWGSILIELINRWIGIAIGLS